jgi:transcription elongation factor GreA
VGEDEANVRENMISFSSPIARAMIGKEEGDIISVTAPSGVIEYEILQVEYV